MRIEDYISIPEYYKRFCDENVDLNEVRNIPCKFHNEKHGKSFTYSAEKRMWRCWGSCHCGGGVVQLHRLNYRLHNDTEARESLLEILGIKTDEFVIPEEAKPDESLAQLKVLQAKAIRLADTVERWLELDYEMSQYPITVDRLEMLIERWET